MRTVHRSVAKPRPVPLFPSFGLVLLLVSPMLANQPAPAPPVLAVPTDSASSGKPSPAAISESSNPALGYWRAWSMTDAVRREALTSVAPTSLKEPPQEKAVNAAADLAEVADMLIRASRKPDADWGVEYTRGVAALLPELGLIRFSTRLLRTTAAAALHDPKPDVRRAGECTVATLRMARHAAAPKLLIASLVSAAVASAACEDASNLAALNRLDQNSRDEILVELRALQAPDALKFRAAITGGERDLLRWMTDAVQSERADPKGVMLALGALTSAKNAAPLSKVLSTEALASDLKKQTLLFDALADAWPVGDGAARLEAIEKRAAAGEFGIFANAFGPAVSRAKASELKALATIAQTIKTLESYTPPKDLPPPRPAKSLLEELGTAR